MIAALLLLAQITPLPAEPSPVEATIAAIDANPKKFDGKVVRLHGYVNDCTRGCALAERPTSAAGGAGTSLPIVPDKKFEDIVLPLVPTYVELDARFRAGCDAASICVDGAPKLTVVTVRGVVSPEPPPFENP